MTKTIEKYLESIIKQIDNGIDLFSGQLPLVAQELVTYAKYGSLVWGVFCFLLFLLCCYGLIVGLKNPPSYENNYKDESKIVTCIILSVVVGILSGVGFLCNLHTFLLVHFAPRIYIIDYLKTMLK